jgi:adenylyl- and sulfurtransferase ThiI
MEILPAQRSLTSLSSSSHISINALTETLADVKVGSINLLHIFTNDITVYYNHAQNQLRKVLKTHWSIMPYSVVADMTKKVDPILKELAHTLDKKDKEWKIRFENEFANFILELEDVEEQLQSNNDENYEDFKREVGELISELDVMRRLGEWSGFINELRDFITNKNPQCYQNVKVWLQV